MGLEPETRYFPISSSHNRHARPSLLRLSLLLHRTPLLPLAMTLHKWVQHGRPVASRARTRALQPDGTLRCPANQTLTPHEHRREADGSLRVVYGASIHSCRPCPLREQCQWNGGKTRKPRQVSVLLHPLVVGSAPLAVRMIGAAENTGAPACSLCDTNVSR